MNQSVIVFADAAARTTAIPSPVEGMLTYLADTNAYESWNGSAFVNINDNTDAIPKSTVTTAQDLIVADGASSVTRLGVGTDDQVLSVVAGEVAWADAATSPVTTQGDLIVGDAGGDEARLAIGTAGKLLSSNGTTAIWSDAPASGSMTLIASGDLASGSAWAVTSIPGGYKDLRFELRNFSTVDGGNTAIRFRNGTTNLQQTRYSRRYDTSWSDDIVSNTEAQNLYSVGTTLANASSMTFNINNYDQTTYPMTYEFHGSGAVNSSLAQFGGGIIEKGSVVNSISSNVEFNNGTFAIYGVN
jgi:hypothetical protein